MTLSVHTWDTRPSYFGTFLLQWRSICKRYVSFLVSINAMSDNYSLGCSCFRTENGSSFQLGVLNRNSDTAGLYNLVLISNYFNPVLTSCSRLEVRGGVGLSFNYSHSSLYCLNGLHCTSFDMFTIQLFCSWPRSKLDFRSISDPPSPLQKMSLTSSTDI